MSICLGRCLLQSAPSLFHWYHHRLAELGHPHKLLQLGTPTCIPNRHGAARSHKPHCSVTQMPSISPWKPKQSPDVLLHAAGYSCPQKLWLHKCVFLILLVYAAPSWVERKWKIKMSMVEKHVFSYLAHQT